MFDLLFERSKPSTISLLFMLTMAAAIILMETADAATSEDEAGELGYSLTTMGGTPGGNASGTIPPIGGQAPAGKPAEEVLYTVSANNVDQHRNKLTPGQIALLNNYPGFEIEVYPSTRRQCYPSSIEESTRSNALRASLPRDTKAPVNAELGVPFPIPQSGLEAIFNHLMRPQPSTMTISTDVAVRTGANEPNSVRIDSVHLQATEAGKRHNYSMASSINPRSGEFRTLVRLDFDEMSIQGLTNEIRRWSWEEGRRRVVRDSRFKFDAQAWAGRMTADSLELFNGSPHKYDWTLDNTTHEILMGYGAEYGSKSSSEIAGLPSGVGYPRVSEFFYQLHRAHRVEATLGSGERHIYTRRVLYFDEDSWIAVSADLYDGRGSLWRTHQGFIGRHPDNSGHTWCLLTDDISYDLQGSSYVLTKRTIKPEGARIKEEDFAPSTLARRGAASFFK